VTVSLPETTPETASRSVLEGANADVTGADNAGESRHRYPTRAVLLDYLYAGLGLLFTLGPLGLAASAGPAAWFLGGLALLFAVYGVRTVLRHRIRILVSDDGLNADGLLRRHLPWAGLSRCTLRYYSTRRNRDGGWMQLTLRSNGRSVRVYSQIEGFDRIVRRAAHAAAGRGLSLDNATTENLRALGLAPGVEDDV